MKKKIIAMALCLAVLIGGYIFINHRQEVKAQEEARIQEALEEQARLEAEEQARQEKACELVEMDCYFNITDMEVEHSNGNVYKVTVKYIDEYAGHYAYNDTDVKTAVQKAKEIFKAIPDEYSEIYYNNEVGNYGKRDSCAYACQLVGLTWEEDEIERELVYTVNVDTCKVKSNVSNNDYDVYEYDDTMEEFFQEVYKAWQGSNATWTYANANVSHLRYYY